MRPLVLSSFLLLYPLAATAQNGDRAGETQRDLPPEWQVPTRGALSPAEALAEFVVAPGYEVQLVAAEPLVQSPVQIAFDGDGSLWALEMRGYMPDAEGTNEQEGVGRVVNLRDTDGDGVMDQSTVFLDNLVLPRAIAPAYGGLFIVEPPNLMFCRDTTGDGVADDIRVLISGFAGLQSPEHAGNGLRYGIDNVYETSQHNRSFWFDGEAIDSRRVGAHGQWGVTRDDHGRLFYSPNSDPLIGDVVPKHYAARNPETRGLVGVPRRLATDKRTWPVHLTPGVNRGYNTSTLRKDGTLASFTAACGPEIFRGEALGEDDYGDAFICETVGNLVKQYDLSEAGGALKATQKYENQEFLASTDERFRPVNLLTGPDGALYIVDMYRGVVQHKIFMTTWLRKQVEARELELPIDRGRIWRVVKKGVPLQQIEDLSIASNGELVERIATSPNGTVRDTAQRLLVERGSLGPVAALRTLAIDEEVADYRRISALWTLDGLGAMNRALVNQAAASSEPELRKTATRLAETLDPLDAATILSGLLQDEEGAVALQAILSCGELPDAEAFELLDGVLAEQMSNPALRQAAYSGLGGREAAFLLAMGAPSTKSWLSHNGAAQRQVFKDLSEAVVKRRRGSECTQLLSIAGRRLETAPWQSMVVLDEIAARTRAGTNKPKPLVVYGTPIAWGDLTAHEDGRLYRRAATVDTALRWAGRPGMPEAPRDNSLTAVIARGKRLYGHCMSCHQPNGRGLPPIYPPLDESPFVNGPPEHLARILLHGLEGRIKVQGRTYNQSMPPAPLKTDADIAAVMTYIRQAWDNIGDPIDEAFVKRVREESKGHKGPWSPKALEASPSITAPGG